MVRNNSVTAALRKEKVVRPSATGHTSLKPVQSPESRQFVEGSQVPPVPGANTGKLNKFSAKSPLITTMGSSQGKAF